MKSFVDLVNKGASGVAAVVRTVALVAIGAALTLFTVQNLATIEVRFGLWRLAAPGAALIFGIFAFGVAFGWLIGAMRRARRTQMSDN